MGEKMMERDKSEEYEAYKVSLANMINLVDTHGHRGRAITPSVCSTA
jgi:hypothetical protein